ncbi:MAG: hypothetical protein QOG33_363 [Gaiellales bacterium]|jgi:hypothetical protein|nr:hypothetical protein [Gaiellales bacterium]
MFAGVVFVAIALAGAVWWYVKDHSRISQADLQTTVARRAGVDRAVCLQRDPNAAHWLCVAIGRPGPPRCLQAHVRPWGSVELHQAYQKCAENATLGRYFAGTKPAS